MSDKGPEEVRTKVELVSPNHPQAGENKFETPEEASAFLKEAARNKANLTHFVSMWEQSSPKRKQGSAHQEKRQMFKDLAGRLAHGSLRVRHQRTQVGGVVTVADANVGFRETRTTWNPGSQLKIRDRPDPAPPPPPEPPTNVIQQVDALKRAAKSGAPFCEKCQGKHPDNDGG